MTGFFIDIILSERNQFLKTYTMVHIKHINNQWAAVQNLADRTGIALCYQLWFSGQVFSGMPTSEDYRTGNYCT